MSNYNITPSPIIENYRILGENERLYDQQEFCGATKIVEAEYEKSEIYPGNPMVEALPRPRTSFQLFMDCQKEMRDFNYSEMIRKPLSQQIEHLVALRDLHYVLPSQATLETSFYMALLKSYGHRIFMESRTKDVEMVINNSKEHTNRIMVGINKGGAFGGFSLIGPSGCGKTTELNDLLEGIPQVILHPHKDGSISIQLVYIVVDCPARSNFRALLQAIGTAIDRALGNTAPCYEKLLTTKSRDNLGIAYNQLSKIIESLSIGMIILDEFQNMNLDPSMENSMSSLLFVGNHTRCVFGVVGTRYSKEKLFNTLDDSLKSYRRLGDEIPAGNYCTDKTFVFNIIRWLFRYQLFSPRIELPTNNDFDKEARGEITLSEEGKTGKELMETLYECSRGIIDQIVSIFTFMNVDFIMKAADDKPVVNTEFVKKTAQKYFPTMQNILEKTDRLTQDEEEELKKQREEKMQELLRLQKEKEEFENNINELHMEMEDAENRQEDPIDVIRDKAVKNISMVAGSKYNQITITKKVEAVIASLMTKKQPITLSEVVMKASERLLRTKSDARPDYTPTKAEMARKAQKIDLDACLGLKAQE